MKWRAVGLGDPGIKETTDSVASNSDTLTQLLLFIQFIRTMKRSGDSHMLVEVQHGHSRGGTGR